MSFDKNAFDKWMKQVDQELLKISGFDSNSLADHLYADAFEDGLMPGEVALEVLQENGFPLEELGL